MQAVFCRLRDRVLPGIRPTFSARLDGMQGLVSRNAVSRLLDLLSSFRVVLLGGARQNGRTTLVRDLLELPGHAWFSSTTRQRRLARWMTRARRSWTTCSMPERGLDAQQVCLARNRSNLLAGGYPESGHGRSRRASDGGWYCRGRAVETFVTTEIFRQATWSERGVDLRTVQTGTEPRSA